MTDRDILEKLDELKEKATPGPWDNRVTNGLSNLAKARHIWTEYGFVGEFNCESSVENAEFIVALVNSYDQLAARLRAAEAACDAVEAKLPIFAPHVDEDGRGASDFAYHQRFVAALEAWRAAKGK